MKKKLTRPCRKCGTLFDSHNCPECHKKLSAKWNLNNSEKLKIAIAKWMSANPGKMRAARRKWYQKNRKKALETAAKYRESNRIKTRAACAKWRAENPEAKRVYMQNRRAKERKNGGTLSRKIAEKLYALQKGKCVCCGKPLGDNYQLDHRMPIALGGKNEDWNMQLLRQRCNNQKSARHPVDFMQSRGFLL